MTLEEMGLQEANIKKLNKKGFETVEDIQKFFPRKYYDFTKISKLMPLLSGEFIAVTGTFKKMEVKKTNKTLMLKAKVFETDTEKKLNIMWIGSFFLKDIIKDWEGKEVIVCGQLTFNEEYHSYHMNNPLIFSPSIEKHKTVYTVYTKMSGISEEWMSKMIRQSLEQPIIENVPEELVKKYHLMQIKEAYHNMHFPESMEKLKQAQKRIVCEELYRFAYELEEQSSLISDGSVYNINNLHMVREFKKLLPFELTASQKKACDEMIALAKDGRRIDALVQGDVGSGKTAVAFTMMLALAGSGYQAVLVAPTDILAKQHYNELSEYADKLGIKAVFLNGKLKAAEKKKIYKEIADGTAQLIVGTHSVASEGVKYKDLALAVIDEEHRFGVGIEKGLFMKSEKGMHHIVMSATPIPRTIADTLFSEKIRIYDLERPSGRQEVQTAIFNNDVKIYEFIKKQHDDGRQAFVVCPLVDDGASSRKDVLSVSKVEDDYKKRFELDHLNIASVTGKTKKEDAERILTSFKNREIDILIATTVIEVGVNNPNVSTIVINNAERFGVAQLHQLRGRVGRGKYKGYCILKSADRENARLKLLCSTTDGFELAKEDAIMRGPGDILGERQSGKNKDIELALKYPNMFKRLKMDIKQNAL